MVVKTIRDIKLDKNKITLYLEDSTTIEIPRRKAEGILLKPAGDYDNDKWTAIAAYRKLVGQDVQVETRMLKRFHGPGVYTNDAVDPRQVVTLYHRS